ncbi:DUF305 domain-containing protein [Nonomuraea sp. NPDC049784]|uniref:DUF305 domain-containing protein n=1 Tax=Nonomuraea sp. NPDC049784 TaxID=3154361 RepID=UPI0033DEE8EB
MKRSRVAGIAASAVLATVAVTGISVAVNDMAQQVTEITSGQQGAAPAGWSMTGPYGSTRSVNVSDEADYLTRMVAYHQEAVAAARHLQRSDRPQMRALGASIAKTQSAEAATMKAWLGKWYPGRYGAETGYQTMMRELSRLSGDALDEAFLRDMIGHHMVAVMMSQQLLSPGRAQHGEVAAFAAKVRDDRHAEISQMQRYLADWFGGWSMPCGGRSAGSSPAPSQGTRSRGPGTTGR